MTLWRVFLADCRGNMAMLFALGFSAMAMVATLGIDSAMLNAERRSLQHAADLAAIIAATRPHSARQAAGDVLREAGFADGDVRVSVGHYTPNPSLAPEARFIPNGQPLNAARVELERAGTLLLSGEWFAPPRHRVTATASTQPLLAFSVGSRLAQLDAGIANSILGQLAGTELSLSALDYAALAKTQINALDFLDALAFDMGLSAGTYTDILSAAPRYGTLARVMSKLVAAHQATILRKLAGGTATIPLMRLFDLGPLGRLSLHGDAETSLTAQLSALDILTAAALAGGRNQVSLNLGAAVPGLTAISVSLAIGELPRESGWFSIGPQGISRQTAQVRLRIVSSLLSGPALLGAGVRLPLYLDIAPSVAEATMASCPLAGTRSGSATIMTQPGLARLSLGEVSEYELQRFSTPASLGATTLLQAPLLRVTAKGHAVLASPAPVPLQFSASEIAAGTIKTAHTTSAVTSLTGSLLASLDLDISVLGIGVAPPSLVRGSLNALLTPLAPTLDLVMERVLAAMGLSLGSADVRVFGTRCPQAVLVQ